MWSSAAMARAVVDHFTYALCSDGDLMEGVAYEAVSLAGHLALGKRIYLYDCNGISIDGATDLAFGEDVGGRFAACGWHVLDVDAHDQGAIPAALEAARGETLRPSLIICRSHIGYGSPRGGVGAGRWGAAAGARGSRPRRGAALLGAVSGAAAQLPGCRAAARDHGPVGVEAATGLGWERWLGRDGVFVGVDDRFGASAPAAELYTRLGITAEHIADAALRLLGRSAAG